LEKEAVMSNTPNRNRNESAERRQPHKQSGDQHILPEDETELSPHRPHRMSREDMQKHAPPEKDSGDETKH
jgi:hypothetical protein